jgi:hypothetical protein
VREFPGTNSVLKRKIQRFSEKKTSRFKGKILNTEQDRNYCLPRTPMNIGDVVRGTEENGEPLPFSSMKD